MDLLNRTHRRRLRVAFDLDGTIVGFVKTGPATEKLALRAGIVDTIRKTKADGHTVVLWTFGNRKWWDTVRRTFPVLDGLFDQVITRDDLRAKITTGRGFPEPVKDVRLIGADLLVDNDPLHAEWARRHGLAKRYLTVRTFGVA